MGNHESTQGLLSPFGHGGGYPEYLPLDSPAVATDLTYKVTGAFWERIAALTARLVTDGNAGNRSVILQVLDQDAIPIVQIPPAAVQITGLTRDYYWLPNINAASGPLAGVYLAPAPAIFLQGLWSVVVHVDTVKAGDQLSRCKLYRERFTTGPDGIGIGSVERRLKGEPLAHGHGHGP